MEPSGPPLDFVQGVLASEGPFVSVDGKNPGAEEIKKLFSPLGYFTAVMDGAGAPDKAALLSALAAAFRFPAYFGRNWDALLDCMRSLPEFAPAKGYALIIKNSDRLLEASPQDRDAFNDVAATAAGFLAENYKVRLKIIML